MGGGIREMNDEQGTTRLNVLVLALVRKRVSMPQVVKEGFTPGQVARALLALEDLGMIIDSDQGLALSESGLKALTEGDKSIEHSGWVSPLEGARVGSGISVLDVFLPQEYVRLD